MAKTSKNNIYYNDDENSIADVLADMKKLAESTDEAIENAKYDDKQIKQEILTLKKDNVSNKDSISNIEKKNIEQDKDITNNIKSIEELKTENEALKAENKLIKEQIPSATASGNSIHVEDSGTLDFNWKINGGHAQAITTQPENYIDDREARGKTILEATSLYLPIVNLKAGNGYYFKIFDNNNKIKNDSRYLAAEFYDENKVKIKWGPLGFPVDFTEEMATKVKYAKIYYNGNDTDKVIGNTVIKKIGLKITSSVSADDIDMFVPDSPSPGCPSEIETVGSNINYFDENTVESKFLNSKTGQTSDNASWRCTDFRKILSKQYNFSWESDSLYFQATVCYYDKNKTFISGNEYGIYGIYSKTFEIPDGANYMKVAYSITVNGKPVTRDKIKLEIGNKRTLYSPFMCGSVEIDVVNKNIMPIVNLGTSWEYTERGIKSFGKNKGTDITKFYIKKGQTIKIGLKLLSQSTVDTTFTWYVDNEPGRIPSFGRIQNLNLNQVYERSNTADKDCEIKGTRWGDEVSDIFEFQLWAEIDNLTNYIKHQSQTAIMPIQQEMLEGDYVADVEHHEWEKLVLTGNEGFVQAQNVNKLNYFYLSLNSVKIKGKIISNMLKNIESRIIWNKTSYDDVVSSASNSKTINIMLSDTTITTLQQFKEKLKELYNAGTPVIIYYKLAEPIDLELTSEQKAVREQKLYTYKNITNIDVSDELASIDVNYKKDPTTEHDELQNQIDEIKQLISTTETSALLLDNLQKDVESEVE